MGYLKGEYTIEEALRNYKAAGRKPLTSQQEENYKALFTEI